MPTVLPLEAFLGAAGFLPNTAPLTAGLTAAIGRAGDLVFIGMIAPDDGFGGNGERSPFQRPGCQGYDRDSPIRPTSLQTELQPDATLPTKRKGRRKPTGQTKEESALSGAMRRLS